MIDALVVVIIVARMIDTALFLWLLVVTVRRIIMLGGEPLLQQTRIAMITLWAAMTFDNSYRGYVWIRSFINDVDMEIDFALMISLMLTTLAAVYCVNTFTPWKAIPHGNYSSSNQTRQATE